MTDKKVATVNYDDLKVVKAAASANSGRREIPDDFKYNPKKLKHLKGILHNVSVALGTLTSAFNEFSKFKGPDISPDGRLGGVGYILNLKDIKQNLQNSIYSLSDIADCIADELTNPKWEAEDDKEVKELIEEKEKVEDKVEEDIGPNDIRDNPDEEDAPEPETAPEPAEENEPAPEQEIKAEPQITTPVINERSASSKALDMAVRQSLMKFIGNN